MTAYNLQRYLMNFIYSSLKRCKDNSYINTYEIIKQITNKGAKLKLSYNILYVSIGYFNDRRTQEMAEKLCEYLNSFSPKTCDKFGFRIRYQVEKR